MTEDTPAVPGENEHSLIELVEAHHEGVRRAEGTTDANRRASVQVRYEQEQWLLAVSVSDSIGTTSREVAYPSRGDVYRAFDWLVDKHDLEEVERDG